MTDQEVPAVAPVARPDHDFSAPLPDEFAGAASDVDWIWPGYLSPGRVTVLTSQWKCGKTTLLSVLIARMAAGGELAGRRVRAGRVLVVSEEDQILWARRCRQLGIARHARFMCRPFRGRHPTPDEWSALVASLVERQRTEGLDLVVIDALAGFVPNGLENDSRTVNMMLHPLQALTMAGTAVLILHHPRKGPSAEGQAARGSSLLSGSADILLEMDGLSGPTADDRRRRVAGYSRFPETPRRLVIELNADGTDYAALGDFDAPELDDGWPVLFQVLADARGKLTRREILAEWPPDYRKPDDVTLWRWLTRAVKDGRAVQQGTGRKDDPFRYWLDGMEEVWRADPFYLEPLSPPEEEWGRRRLTLDEVLATRKGESDESGAEPVAGREGGPGGLAAVGRKRLGGRGQRRGAPAGDVPAVGAGVPGVVGAHHAVGPAAAVRADAGGRGAVAAGAAAVAGPPAPAAGGEPDPPGGGGAAGADEPDGGG
jgi:AAA domain